MGSTANLASTTMNATTKTGAMAVETMTQRFDHCLCIKVSTVLYPAWAITHRQLLVVPQAQADEEASKRDEEGRATSKVDPPQLLLDCLPTTGSDRRVVDVAKAREEGEDKEGDLEDESGAPTERVGNEAAERSA